MLVLQLLMDVALDNASSEYVKNMKILMSSLAMSSVGIEPNCALMFANVLCLGKPNPECLELHNDWSFGQCFGCARHCYVALSQCSLTSS